MLSEVTRSQLSYIACILHTTNPPAVIFVRSSRTVVTPSISYLAKDRNQPVSQRFELSSRTALICEQQNLWNLFQLQEAMSQHRGAKQFVQLGLSQTIGLLSLAYLLFVDR